MKAIQCHPHRVVVRAMFMAVVLWMGAVLPAHAMQAVSGQLNIATAQADEFALLPGIGEKKAEAIVAYRAEHPFAKLEDLIEVKGIGPKMFEKLRPYLTLEGESSLKPASQEEASAKEGSPST